MPEDPNNPIPQRTEPATTPKNLTPADAPEVLGDDAEREEAETEQGAREDTLAMMDEDMPDVQGRLADILPNPATVTAVMEFLNEQGLALDDVEVKEGFWGWSEGSDIATIEYGSREFFVSPDDETTTRLAIAMVKQDLEEEPGMFNRSFIEGYIDRERLASDLLSDVEEQVRESPDSYGWEPDNTRYNERGEEDEEGKFNAEGEAFEEQTEPSDDWVTAKAEELLRDPVAYLQEIYGDADGIKQAIEIAGINTDEAAEDAVAADGEGHFLGTYDGSVNDLPSGGQWWRHN